MRIGRHVVRLVGGVDGEALRRGGVRCLGVLVEGDGLLVPVRGRGLLICYRLGGGSCVVVRNVDVEGAAHFSHRLGFLKQITEIRSSVDSFFVINLSKIATTPHFWYLYN